MSVPAATFAYLTATVAGGFVGWAMWKAWRA